MKRNWSDKERESLQKAILQWYAEYGRHDLPWRNLAENNINVPYGVLVAEIMLQQTQVDRVAPKFLTFIRRFPTISDLAVSSTGEVVTLWAGLGYNRRAVMLHQAARTIVAKYNGKIPNSEKDLLALPGIGLYTAGAILSFGLNLPVGVIDTNIKRFYQLLMLGYTQESNRDIIFLDQQYIPRDRSSNWHAGIMDLMNQIPTSYTPAEQQSQLLHILSINPPNIPSLGRDPFVRLKQPPFKGSKRFFRGQIINLLRQMRNTKLLYKDIKNQIPIPDEYVYEEIMNQLRKDGLVEFEGTLVPDSRVTLPSH